MNQITNHPLYRKHTIDSAMSSLWDFYKNKFAALFVISLIMSLISHFASTGIDLSELQSITDTEEMLLKMKDYLWPMILISLISLFFTTILHYFVIYNPLDTENNIFRCTLSSLKYFIPYLVIIILLAFFSSFALFLGLIAFIIGALFVALYILTIYLFILPILMVEGPNIANAIVRTLKLSHRNFWPNIGWTAVFIVILLVVSVILSGLILLPFTGSFLKAFTSPENATALVEVASNPVFIILNALVSALIYPALPIFATILYFNSRAREEQPFAGGPPERNEDSNLKVEDLYAKPYSDDHPEKPENI